MKRHHPVIATWIAQRARDRRAFIEGGRNTYGGWFNNLDHRQHRILSQIFYAVEQHGVLPQSSGYPHFRFEYRGEVFGGAIGPTCVRIAGQDQSKVILKFAVIDLTPEGLKVARVWSDEGRPLEQKIPEIVSAIVAVATTWVNNRNDDERVVLPTLLKLAEQHQSASLIRRFLRSLARNNPDLSIIVADHALHQWVSWAHSQVDKFDPLNRGIEQVFREVAANSRRVRQR